MQSAAKSLAKVRRLTVSYVPPVGQIVRALESVNLEIHEGEVVGVLGESGCGKSTLAGAILQLLPTHARYDEGEIYFRDQDLRTLPESALHHVWGRNIALIGQDPQCI